MTEPATKPRRLACATCGTEFGCAPEGGCWCFDEAFRLPVPAEGGECLCPDCLRKLAKQQAKVSAV